MTDEGSPADPGFEGMGLSETTLAAVARMGYKTPSPIQAGLIVSAIAGRDCIGNAPTGTGKTAAFLIPILERIDDRQRRPQALILAPTRELVVQICHEFEKLAFGRRTRAVAVVGGESIYQQQRILSAGCQLIVATPGRLMDLMARKTVRLEHVTQIVLDEADQMLDIGFRPAVETILQEIPKPRQTFLLSATMPSGVRELSRKYLNDPFDVRLIHDDEDATVPSIRQSYVMVAPERKFELLIKLLEREQPTRAIVFCRTRRGADRLGTLLRAEGHRAEPMHGDLSQAQRNRVLHAFRGGRLTTLVATDVVGRGIDVQGVSHVVNFDLPDDPTHYVHRIGRTGRMGNDGIAFSIVLPDQAKLLDEIEKCIARELERDHVEGVPTVPRPSTARPQPSARRPFRRPQQSRGGRPPFRPAAASNGVRRRREREAQGAR
jgi:ATP-dependent RNA helicase DeaD